MEHEVKVPVDDLGAVRHQLAAAGWRCVLESARETNLLLDTDSGALRAGGRALRLRACAGRHTLTLKGPVQPAPGVVKTRTELEVEVDDPTVTLAILGELGFTARMRYEKDRELWQRGELTVALDHTPLGDFVEVEGPEAKVLGTARALGLDSDRALLEPYPVLWERRRRQCPDLPPDMVFCP